MQVQPVDFQPLSCQACREGHYASSRPVFSIFEQSLQKTSLTVQAVK